ncbi:MAG: integrating conjugative element protein [Methyloglobulus sp.]|nr:integrating conjugative element protein [Methyloglobulus sp.]
MVIALIRKACSFGLYPNHDTELMPTYMKDLSATQSKNPGKSALAQSWMAFLLLSGCLHLPGAQSAPFAPARDSTWYYQIGGAKAVSAAANPSACSITLGGNLDLSHIYSCGNFSPIAGITNILNNAKGQVMSVYGGLISAATSAISSLPAYIMQRAAPGLYDLYQNAVLRGETALDVANASCEQMESEIRNGQNPYERFTQVAKGFDWKVQMGNGSIGSSSSDVKTAKEAVETNNGSNGIPWLGGHYAGGNAQPPVLAITDTVKAGYNIELGRAVDNTGQAPTGTTATPLGKAWKTPQEAQDYALFVLGDVELSTNKDQQRQATPGHGILPKIENDKTPILATLRMLVSGNKTLEADELEKVSSPGIEMTREVIDAIRALPTAQEQEAAMQKLADEAATGINLEKALFLRRLLQTGRMEPNIYASGLSTDIDLAVSHITQAIDNVLYETKIRREMFAQTATVLLGTGQNRTKDNADTTTATPNDVKPIENGEVK